MPLVIYQYLPSAVGMHSINSEAHLNNLSCAKQTGPTCHLPFPSAAFAVIQTSSSQGLVNNQNPEYPTRRSFTFRGQTPDWCVGCGGGTGQVPPFPVSGWELLRTLPALPGFTH